MAYQDLIQGDNYFEGQLVSAEPTSLVLSGDNAQGGIVAFGLGLVRGSADNALVIPSATGGIFMGVSRATDTIEKRDGYSIDANSKMGYPVAHNMAYIRRGLVAVPVDSDCVQGQPVYLIHTASSGQVPGHFRKDANTSAADLVANAVFWKTLTAAGIGLIRLNLT